MIRVTYEEREPEDIAANSVGVGPAGSLVLELVEEVEVQNPQPPFQRMSVVASRRVVKIVSPTARWLTADPVPADELPQPEPELEATHA